MLQGFARRPSADVCRPHLSSLNGNITDNARRPAFSIMNIITGAQRAASPNQHRGGNRQHVLSRSFPRTSALTRPLRHPCLQGIHLLTCFQIRFYGPSLSGSMPLQPAASLCPMRQELTASCIKSCRYSTSYAAWLQGPYNISDERDVCASG